MRDALTSILRSSMLSRCVIMSMMLSWSGGLGWEDYIVRLYGTHNVGNICSKREVLLDLECNSRSVEDLGSSRKDAPSRGTPGSPW